MAKKSVEVDWSQDPPAQEPNFSNIDSPTIQNSGAPSTPPPPPPPLDYNIPPAPPEKNNKIWIWVVVILAILILCCCCVGVLLIAGLAGSSESSNIFDFSYLIGTLLV